LQALSIYKQVNKSPVGGQSNPPSSETESPDRVASFTPIPEPTFEDEYFEGYLPPTTSGVPLSEESISDLLKETRKPLDDLPLEEQGPAPAPASHKDDDYVPGESTITGRRS